MVEKERKLTSTNDVLDHAAEVAAKMPGWSRSLAKIPGGILVIGAGWLGTKAAEYLNAKIYPPGDAGDTLALRCFLDDQKPSVVLNFVGKTGRPNIDWCEDHKEETFYSNVTVPLILYNECLKRDIRFVHISSGCIFDGNKEYKEDSTPNPVSYYAETKVRAEENLRLMSDREDMLLIPRIRMPIDSVPHERNLITKLANYEKVISARNSVTIVEDFLYALKMLLILNCYGTYHITNPGSVDISIIRSWYKDMVDPAATFSTIEPYQLNTKARRSNCVLDTTKLQKEGIILRDAPRVIKGYLRLYAKFMGKDVEIPKYLS